MVALQFSTYLVHMALAVEEAADQISPKRQPPTDQLVEAVLVVIPAARLLVEPAETMLPLLVVMVLVAVVLEVEHRLLLS
jgi:hypothetical protein